MNEKIKRFLADKVMSQSVRDVLTSSFLKNRGQRDVHTLAAERLAIDLLDSAWKELERIASAEPREMSETKNPGI